MVGGEHGRVQRRRFPGRHDQAGEPIVRSFRALPFVTPQQRAWPAVVLRWSGHVGDIAQAGLVILRAQFAVAAVGEEIPLQVLRHDRLGTLDPVPRRP